jgi:hypothetical protein
MRQRKAYHGMHSYTETSNIKSLNKTPPDRRKTENLYGIILIIML